jgi:quinol monooxygenase YgiN
MARRLTIMEHKGDPDALLATIKETIDPVARVKAPDYGGIAHAVARTEDGLLIVNVWESEEGSEAMRQHPEVQAAIERMASAGVSPPQVRHYELLQYEAPAKSGQGA